ncbi:MAG TPA: SLC13 family permease, partial [Chthoniobacteraceae bacterium]|nr:SLC13 family permease [Chthoniobacteraceae bacterium]
MFLPVLAASSTILGIDVQYWPFVVLFVCIAAVITMISVLRVHAFIALVFAAFLAGFMTYSFKTEALNKIGGATKVDAQVNQWVAAVELTSVELGGAAASIAISIGLASIIGLCLMESGAADKVVRRFLAAFGEKRAALAILVSTYILSIPIFFDTMFMLMVPLARALRLRTGKDYMLYVMCICCGGVITHSLTVPHPGPLAMVDNLKVEAGASLLWGIIAGAIPCGLGYFVAKRINSRTPVELREIPGAPLEDLHGISAKPESELPSFFASILPVIGPIFLISTASFAKFQYPDLTVTDLPTWARTCLFLGNKNIALLLGTVVALWVLARQRNLGFHAVERLIGPPIETAGVIILITAAGGAFGGMLRNAGVGDAINLVASHYRINMIFLGWLVAVVLRIAQGSATVAMLTTSAIIYPMI